LSIQRPPNIDLAISVLVSAKSFADFKRASGRRTLKHDPGLKKE